VSSVAQDSNQLCSGAKKCEVVKSSRWTAAYIDGRCCKRDSGLWRSRTGCSGPGKLGRRSEVVGGSELAMGDDEMAQKGEAEVSRARCGCEESGVRVERRRHEIQEASSARHAIHGSRPASVWEHLPPVLGLDAWTPAR
jgi:hypothetical protein